MNSLTTHDIEAIKRHDWEVHISKGMMNRNRFYTYLIAPLFSPDLEVHIVAVQSARRVGICGNRPTFVKDVVRASVDDSNMYLKDIAFRMMAGYCVDWSKEGLNKVGWSYGGRWQAEAYKGARTMWKIQCPVINPAALQYHERFKWCAWNPGCGHILDYLKVYAKHPRIEMLSKVGAGRFATRAGFVAQLEKDKGLMRFFSANLEEIKAEEYGCDVIRIAYRHGITMAEARKRIYVRATFRRYGLPRVVDAMRAKEFISRTKGCNNWNYCEYLRDCQELGLDLTDTKVAFPKQFAKRRTIVADQMAEIERRRKAEETKKKAEAYRQQDAAIAAVAGRFSRLERARSAFVVVLPRRSADLIREGDRMKNCLGDGHYAAKMARGETIIAFVRHADKPRAAFVAVEYSLDQKKVIQCYGSNNSKPAKPVIDFVERVFKKTKAA